MKKVFIFIIAVGLTVWLGMRAHIRKQAATTQTPVATAPLSNPTFSWTYRSFVQDEFPKTAITLTARSVDGTVVTKDIDSPDGSCNDYYKPDADVYPHSTMIICYAAGLGHYYKVVQSGTDYLVLRKTFEEGSPEYTPPDLPYKEIARF